MEKDTCPLCGCARHVRRVATGYYKHEGNVEHPLIFKIVFSRILRITLSMAAASCIFGISEGGWGGGGGKRRQA